MMKQQFYELKKSILSKGAVVIIITLLCFNAVLSFFYAKQAPESEQTQNYATVITSVIKNANNQINQLSIKEPNSYAVKYLNDVVEIYSELRPLKLAEQKVNGWDLYLKFNASNPLILICIVFISIMIFSTDIVSGFQPIIYATANGRARYILIKIAEVVIVSLILCVLFFAAAFLGMMPACSFSGFDEYIQSFAAFKTAPYALRAWQAVLLLFGMRVIVTVFVSALVGVVFYLSKNRLVTLISTLLIYGINILVNNIVYLNSDTIAENCNIIAAMDITTILTKYQCVRIFGSPVPAVAVLFVLYFLLFALCSSAVILLYNRFIHLGLKVDLRFNYHSQKEKYHDKTLVGWEFAKVVKNRFVLILMAFLVVAAAVIAVDQYRKFRADSVFFEYIQKLKPMDFNERDSFIKKEQARIDKAYRDYNEYWKALRERVEYKGDAEAVEKEYYYALIHEAPLSKVSEMCSYIRDHNACDELTLIYNTGWMKLYESGDSLPLFLLIVLVATFLASTEFQTKFYPILSATPNGRRNTNRAKLFICIASTTVFFVIITLLQILPVVSFYSLEDMPARLISLQIYRNAPPDIQLWQYLALILLVRYIACILICVLSFQIARLIKVSYIAMIVVTLLVQLPEIIYGTGIDILRYCRFTSFLDGNDFLLLGMNTGYIKSGVIFILFLLACVVMSAISAHNIKE